MIILEKNNVQKIVESQAQADKLILTGFKIVNGITKTKKAGEKDGATATNTNIFKAGTKT